MKTKIILILSLAVLIAFCASCQKTDNTESSEKTPTTESGDVTPNINADVNDGDNKGNDNETDNAEKTEDSENTETGDNTEITENTDKEELTATKDTYYYEEESQGGRDFEIVGELESSEYVIYTNDGGEHFGICDMAMQVIVDPVYTTLGWCPWHEVVYAEPFPEDSEPIVISDKYKIDVHYGHDGTGDDYLIFDNNSGKMFSLGFMYDSVDVSEVKTLKTHQPYINYTGEQTISEGTSYFGDESGMYELLDNLVYSKAEYEFVTDKGSIVNIGECEYADSFTNDFLMVRRNGKVGFVDLLGKDACEFIYTDAQRAFDSKAWVKCQDGSWKVVNLRSN